MKLVLAVFILSYLLFAPSSFARGLKIVPKISSGIQVLKDLLGTQKINLEEPIIVRSARNEIISASKLDYLQVTTPEYPELAREKGWEGMVLIKALVAENGLPVETFVEKSSSYTVLDDSAREAVKQWKFHPAHYENVPYAVLVLIPIQFVLSE